MFGNTEQGLLVVLSAPSGCGKDTVLAELDSCLPIRRSVSMTTRPIRPQETDGVDYYFLSPEAFQQRVANGDFLEWEEVYTNTCYGTLKSEIDRICGNGKVMIFDVDVNGGINIKRFFGDDALAIFVMPPSIEVLEQRLRSRGTETEESIRKRLGRSSKELNEAPRFDVTIVNDDLQRAVEETRQTIEKFLEK